MVQNIFFELSIVIAIATVMSILMKLIKQPIIIGYIITGIILGPFALNIVQSSDTLVAFSQIGITFLLFIVGLNLNFKTLKEVGFLSFVTCIFQVVFTFAIVYLISIFLGFSSLTSLYIGAALAFSSTIIVVKLLSDIHDLESLYGKISLGLLLMQDFLVIFIIMFLSSGFNGADLAAATIFTILKVLIVFVLIWVISNHLLPKILAFVAKSQELLFLFGISWALVLSVILNRAGFSLEMGALFAGISLASSPFHFEIGNKLKPLRDFFIVLFFISLGAQMIFSFSFDLAVKIAILSLIVLIGKPIIVMAITGFMGYRKRIGFLTGLAIAQISEFSFILAVLGMEHGYLRQETVSIITFVGLITIAGSTYMILHSERLYRMLAKLLGIFERQNVKNAYGSSAKDNFKIILFGHNRIGYSLLKSFIKLKKKFLVVDYNPDIIGMLINHKIPYKYGDASDSELLEELNLQNAELVVSTIPQLDINLLLADKIRSVNKKVIIVMTSHQIDDAFKLYDAGADYVLMPHFLGGEHASAMIEKFGTDINKFLKEKVKHIEELSQRKRFGHEHPTHN